MVMVAPLIEGLEPVPVPRGHHRPASSLGTGDVEDGMKVTDSRFEFWVRVDRKARGRSESAVRVVVDEHI